MVEPSKNSKLSFVGEVKMGYSVGQSALDSQHGIYYYPSRPSYFSSDRKTPLFFFHISEGRGGIGKEKGSYEADGFPNHEQSPKRRFLG